jgi:hypothetical protein
MNAAVAAPMVSTPTLEPVVSRLQANRLGLLRDAVRPGNSECVLISSLGGRSGEPAEMFAVNADLDAVACL